MLMVSFSKQETMHMTKQVKIIIFKIFILILKDLNRSFPDWAQLGRTDFHDRLDKRPAETVAIMSWMRRVLTGSIVSRIYVCPGPMISCCLLVFTMAGAWWSSPGTTVLPARAQTTLSAQRILSSTPLLSYMLRIMHLCTQGEIAKLGLYASLPLPR